MWKAYTVALTLLAALADASVVVSIPDLKNIVERIYDGEVECIAPSNVDPHLFSLTSRDLQKAKEAKLLVLANSGILEFEERLKDLATEVLDFEDYEAEILSFPGIGENYHAYWLLPENAMRIASKVKEKLSEIYPEKKEVYEQNFLAFKASLEIAKRDAEKIVENVKDRDYIAMDPHTAYAISALNLSISFAFPEDVAPSALELRNLSSKSCVVAIAEYQRGTKIEEMALKIANEKGCGIAVLKVISDLTPESMLIYNAAILSNLEEGEKGENVLLHILALVAVAEAVAIVVLWRLK